MDIFLYLYKNVAERHHLYVASLPKVYIYIDINAAMKPQDQIRYTVRAAGKEAETLKDSFPESQPDWRFLYFDSAVLINPCGFLRTGQCDGGT